MHKTLDLGILFAIFVIPLYSLSVFTTSKFIKWCSKIDAAIRFELFVLTSKLIKFVVSHGLKLRALCAVTQGLKFRALCICNYKWDNLLAS